MKALPLALLLCVACATAAPEHAYYLLRAPTDGDGTPTPAAAVVGFGSVRVAPYLDRAGLVVQVDAHQVREARYHLWAEPLDQGIRLVLAERVRSRLGVELSPGPRGADTWRYRIDVSVDELHGTLDGEARLIAHWVLRDTADGTVVGTGRYQKAMPQEGDGYPGLVAVELALLDDLALRIAGMLSEVL